MTDGLLARGRRLGSRSVMLSGRRHPRLSPGPVDTARSSWSPFRGRRIGLALMTGAAVAEGQGFSAGTAARIDSLVEAYRRDHVVAGVSVAVARGDRLLFSQGYGLADVELSVPASAQTVYRIGSVAKQFAAALVMRLAEQGKIGVGDDVTKYLPGFPTQGHRVTIHHLLAHTSGIKSYTGLDTTHINTIWRQDLSSDQLIALFKDRAFDFAPGERYAYNNSAYYLLGVIVEKLSGVPYAKYLQESLLEPLGLTATSYCDESAIVPHRARGYRRLNGTMVNAKPISMTIPGAAGAMCSSVLDLVRWTRQLVGGTAVSPGSFQRMSTEARLNGGAGTGYGYGLGLRPLEGRRAIAHSGGINGFSSNQTYLPEEDLTVIVLTNAEGGPLGTLVAAIVRSALAVPPSGGA